MTTYLKHLGQVGEGFGACRKFTRLFSRHLYSISRYSGNTSYVTFTLIPHKVLLKQGLTDAVIEKYIIDNEIAISIIANCRLSFTSTL